VEAGISNNDLQLFIKLARNLQCDVTFCWHSLSRHDLTNCITPCRRGIGQGTLARGDGTLVVS
jgi:hypothetical protein